MPYLPLCDYALFNDFQLFLTSCKLPLDDLSDLLWSLCVLSYLEYTKTSLRASSAVWASEVSLARTRERGAEERRVLCPSRLRRSLARSRETRFTRPNRRACSQAIRRPLVTTWNYTYRYLEIAWNKSLFLKVDDCVRISRKKPQWFASRKGPPPRTRPLSLHISGGRLREVRLYNTTVGIIAKLRHFFSTSRTSLCISGALYISPRYLNYGMRCA